MKYVCDFCFDVIEKDQCVKGIEDVDGRVPIICNACIKKMNNDLEDTTAPCSTKQSDYYFKF